MMTIHRRLLLAGLTAAPFAPPARAADATVRISTAAPRRIFWPRPAKP